MASSCALLDADVRLVASTGEKTCGGGRMSSLLKPQKMEESPMSFADRLRWLAQGGGSSSMGRRKEHPKGIAEWVREGAIRVITDNLVSAPEMSTLSVHLPATPREIVAQLSELRVKSADKGLLVLSTGPASPDHASSGCYLVYDGAADADALFLPPPIDCFDASPEIFGCRPVVMRHSEATGDFTLALVAMSFRTEQYYLLTWSPASTFKGGKVQVRQWTCKAVRLPDEVVQYPFMADVTFAYHKGSLACWVDLYLGVLTCDVLSEDPKFQLKLLPDDYVMGYGPMSRGRPDGHSTMSCDVDGMIKLVYMDGFVDEDKPMDQITITTWTLMGRVPDLCLWMRDDKTELCCRDLWADESFLAIPGLPKRPPTFPILSPDERDVVYFFLSDIGYVDGHVKTKGEHVLGLNLLTKKVQTSSKCSPGRSLQLVPSFIATELPSQESSNLVDQGNATNKWALKIRRT